MFVYSVMSLVGNTCDALAIEQTNFVTMDICVLFHWIICLLTESIVFEVCCIRFRYNKSRLYTNVYDNAHFPHTYCIVIFPPCESVQVKPIFI